MFNISTSVASALAGTGLYQKGINGSIPMEKGEKAIKAIDRFAPEIKAFNEIVKLKANEYNLKLESYKKEHGEENIPSSIIADKETFDREFQEARRREFSISLGDDHYRALIDVCENAKKIWYKALQDRNECEDQEKAAKMQAPSVSEFNDFSDFLESLSQADKE